MSVCLSVRVTAWQKATGYEFFITFSHCNQNEKERERERERERRKQTEDITFM